MGTDSTCRSPNPDPKAGLCARRSTENATALESAALAYTSLADARDKAIEIRKASRNGGDPLTDRCEQKKAADRERLIPDFKTAAWTVYGEREATFRNEVHKKHWIGQLEKFVMPEIGTMRIGRITSRDLLKVLSPIWLTSHETAKRVKQRIVC